MNAPDLDTYLRALMALGGVLLLLGITALALRRMAASGRLLSLGVPRGGRVAVVEAVALDARRRLVLVRRDGVEHLLLLGSNGDLVIESGIGVPKEAARAGAVTAEDPGSMP